MAVTSLMVVTTCVIPILGILFFIWVVKTLFNVPISVPAQVPKPKKINRAHNEEKDLAAIE